MDFAIRRRTPTLNGTNFQKFFYPTFFLFQLNFAYMKRILHLVSVKNITFKSSYNWFKIENWLRNKLLHFWQAALANSAYLVFPQTSMYSGFYWKLLGNALIKLDPPKNWSNRAPLHIFSSRRAQSTFAKWWRIENWERNVIKFMCRINQYCPHFSTSAKDKSKKVNFRKWFGSGNYFDVLFWYSIHSQWQIVGNKKYHKWFDSKIQKYNDKRQNII